MLAHKNRGRHEVDHWVSSNQLASASCSTTKGFIIFPWDSLESDHGSPHTSPTAARNLRGLSAEDAQLIGPANNGPDLLATFLAGNLFRPLLDSPARVRNQSEWQGFLAALAKTKPSDELAAQFRRRWHECHHFMRELVEDDALMNRVARAWLPPYAGPAMTLWRGENIDRFEANQLGLAWSDMVETAELFARGLNATGRGGVVLKANVPASAIIAGPSLHSIQLDEREFTVDTALLGLVTEVRCYPPCF
jgi:hypothetical protein